MEIDLSNVVVSGCAASKSVDSIVNIVAVDDQAEPAMWGLAVQPLEVLHHIFTYVDIHDTVSLSLTCRHIHRCIAHDDLLWREQYLKLFEQPVETPTSWQIGLKRLLDLQRFLRTADRVTKEDRLEDVATTALEMVSRGQTPKSAKNEAFWADLMDSRSNKSCFLSRSSLFSRAGHPLDSPADTEALRQLSAKLHVYYGMSIELDSVEMQAEGAREIHPYARSRVYDLRRYTAKNGWGPLADDGSGKVDWEKAQAIVSVLSCGLRILGQRFTGIMGSFWGHAFHGLSANSFEGRTFGIPIEDQEDEFQGQDPYNVKGTWMRVVNFLDYHDLFAFNFQPPIPPAGQERPPISTKEAIRLIWLQLKVCKIEEAQEGDDPSMPRVHFKGESRSLTNSWDPNGNSAISGYVRKTIHGDIRWTTFSVFQGEERWRSECVQIGEINSARGAVGNWFDKNYDIHGPAGPTAFWKISNDLIKVPGNPFSASAIVPPFPHLSDDFFDSDDDDFDDEDEVDDEDEDDDEDDEDEDELDEDGEDDEADHIPGANISNTVTCTVGQFLTDAANGQTRTEVTITLTDGVVTNVERREI